MSRAFSAALGICALCWLATSALALPLTSGLQGYWQFDGGGNDSSANARDLSMPAGLSFDAGLLGQAVRVPSPTPSSAQDEERVPIRPTDDDAFDFGSGDFTIQLWAKFSNLYGTQVLIEKLSLGPTAGWTVTKEHLSDALKFEAWAAPGGFTATSSNLAIDTTDFHQFVVRRRAAWVDLFFDGADVGGGGTTDPGTIFDADRPLLIGARYGPVQFMPLTGLVDEVAIWSRGLSDGEIAALYNGGNGMAVPEPAILVLLSLGLLGLGVARRFSPAYARPGEKSRPTPDRPGCG